MCHRRINYNRGMRFYWFMGAEGSYSGEIGSSILVLSLVQWAKVAERHRWVYLTVNSGQPLPRILGLNAERGTQGLRMQRDS